MDKSPEWLAICDLAPPAKECRPKNADQKLNSGTHYNSGKASINRRKHPRAPERFYRPLGDLIEGENTKLWESDLIRKPIVPEG